jgi:hypothetical protein
MKQRLLILLAILPGGFTLHAQELFVFTEPASNMATRSIGVRLDNTVYDMGSGRTAYRLAPEVMWGASRNWMFHAAGYASDMFQSAFRPEGGSLYAKYRFFADDGVHRHFRLAAFAKAAWVNNPDSLKGASFLSDEIDLTGTNSGYQAGIVGTQLLHRLALSGSAAYTRRWKDGPASSEALNYTASAGLLLWPRHYTNYRQTNINLMCELLGATALDKHAGFADIAPAVQFIFRSISRLDLGYRTQVAGDMARWSQHGFFVRLEYNFLNAYR